MGTHGYNCFIVQVEERVEKIDGTLPQGAYSQPGDSLLMMAGLPAAGRSFLVERLRQLTLCSCTYRWIPQRQRRVGATSVSVLDGP